MSIEGKEKEKRLDGQSLECGFVGSDGVAPTGEARCLLKAVVPR